MNTRVIAGFASFASTVGLAVANPALADTPETEQSGGLQEIIVTAQKRSTNLERTPISITALSGADLQKEQIRSLEDVQSSVPNFKAGQSAGYAQITIRGIGIQSFQPQAESAVAVNENQVYVSRPDAQLTSLYDLSSVEVLRGPQGTLYGRNATAGAVNITTARPTNEVSGYASETVGNYGLQRFESAIGGALVNDVLLVRMAGFRETRDGYGKNIVTGTGVDDNDSYGVRGTVVFTPTTELKATVIGEYYRENDHAGALHYFGPGGLTGLAGAVGVPPLTVTQGGLTAPNSYNVADYWDPVFDLRTSSATAILEWSKEEFSVRSITGYRAQNSLLVTPIDGGSTNNNLALSGEPDNQFSQELQAHYDTDRMHLTGGLYYFHESDNSNPDLAIANSTLLDHAFGLPIATPAYYVDAAQFGGLVKTNATAAFAEETYELFSGFSLTAGVRYSRESKRMIQRYRFSLSLPFDFATDGTPPPNDYSIPSRTFSATSPKAGLQYQITPQTLLYAEYQKGFRSGGFDTGSVPAKAFAPEYLTDYEVGLKTTAFNNHFRANVGGFFYDYSNLQVSQIVNLTIATSNAATAHLYGVEAEFQYLPVDPLELDLWSAFLHAVYVNYIGPDPARPLIPEVNFSGNHLDNSPDFTASVSAKYTWQVPGGELWIKGESDYSTRYYFSPANIGLLSQSAYAKENAFFSYESKQQWSVTAFVRNLSDKMTRTSGYAASVLLDTPLEGALAPPRTYGVEFSYKF